MKNIGFIIVFVFISFFVNLVCAQQEKVINNFASRVEVQNFMTHMQQKHNFDREQLEIFFKKYDSNKDVLDKISNPAEKLSWGKYKQLLISKDRINKGKSFLIKHKNILLKAEQQFGVPKEMIAAILGIESFYGEKSGNIPVLQSLATLSFDYPPREKFFKEELEHFLLLIKEEKLDPINTMGSYAGAMSPAQFISSSYRTYAVDFANVGTKDLNNMHNAIGSIANYLHKHGWNREKLIASSAKVISNNAGYVDYIERNVSSPKPKYSLQQLKNIGIESKNKLTNDLNKQVALMEFINEKDKKEYWLGFDNFYVITRYNHNAHYAMAVYQLAVELGLFIKPV